jgi:hypothetical protein
MKARENVAAQKHSMDVYRAAGNRRAYLSRGRAATFEPTAWARAEQH